MQQNKKICLITDYFNEGGSGKLVSKALTDLEIQHTLIDPSHQDYTSLRIHNFDVILVWRNFVFGNLLPEESHKVLFYLDDPKWWEDNNRDWSIQNAMKGYNIVFTMQKIKGLEHLHVPMGCDSQIYSKYPLGTFKKEELEYYGADVSFIGTLRDSGRLNLAEEFIKSMGQDIKSFKIWGNGWQNTEYARYYWMQKPVYFDSFVKVVSGSKIVINEHYCNSPNDKDFLVPCVGSALYLFDDKAYGTKEIYPMTPTFKDAKEAVELCKYYIANEEERLKLVQEMQTIARAYTYTIQMKKVLNMVGVLT